MATELTMEKLEEMEPGTIFAKGEFYNSIWVAVRGGVADWAIYWVPENSYTNDRQVASHGTKVYDPVDIHRMVRCDEKSFKKYRY